MAKFTPMISATATTSASSAFHQENPPASAAAALPTTTGATALGRVRGRAPSIQSAMVAMGASLAPPGRAAGTGGARVGPVRLVGAGLVAPVRVKQAAFACFGIAAAAGIALSVTSAWWLLLIGAVCVAGAWFYTGGSRPYGYAGFGEIAVFVFFGLVAVLGTEFVQAGAVTWAGVLGAVAVGSFSSAVLVSNNLRDIPTDAQTGKITLAVRLGDRRTRILFTVLLIAPLVCSAVLIPVTGSPWPLLGLIAAPVAGSAARPVLGGGHGAALIPALRDTGLAMLIWAIGTAIAFVLAR